MNCIKDLYTTNIKVLLIFSLRFLKLLKKRETL